MPYPSLRPATSAVLLCAAIGVGSTIGAQQVGKSPIEIRLAAGPAATTALGRTHLVYELHLTNFSQEPMSVDRLEVLNPAGAALASWSDAALRQRVVVVGATTPVGVPPGQPLTLAPGTRAVAFLWVTLPAESPVPEAVRHRVTVTAPDRDSTSVVTSSDAVVVADSAAPLAPPVSGGPWVAVRGASATSGHRLSLVAHDGGIRVPQRFAVDWLRIGEDGLAFGGEGREVTDWHGYGAPVTAVANGTVVLVRDGTRDTTPRSTPPATVDAEAAPGNVVVLDLGGGRFATYAHLKAGSVRVRQGDRVTTGEPLGRIGNSGNSHGPHLHFQISDGVEPLGSEGLPFSIDHFQLVGRLAGLGPLLSGLAWHPQATQPARSVTAEIPLENMVVIFRN
jgi:murein DD-endopeptidase